MWHFTRIEEGPHKGCFEHPYFVKGKRSLCALMSRKHPPPTSNEDGASDWGSNRSQNNVTSTDNGEAKLLASASICVALDSRRRSTLLDNQEEGVRQLDTAGLPDVLPPPPIHLASPVVLNCCNIERANCHQMLGHHETARSGDFAGENLDTSSSSSLGMSMDKLLEPVADILDSVFRA